MNELTRLKEEEEKAFAMYLKYQERQAKNEQLARKWRYKHLDLKDEIRSIERELSAPLKVVYGEA